MSTEDPIIVGDAAVTSVSSRTGRTAKIVVAVAAVAVAVGGLAVWRVFSGFGSATDAASAVPADADLYVNFDLATFVDGDLLDRIQRTFPEAFDGEAVAGRPVDELDDRLQDEYGITFTDDVMPWVGRSAGLAMWDFDLFATEPQQAMFIVKVRDGDAADRFLERIAGVTGGGTVGLHEGVAIWELSIEADPAFAARVDDMLVVAESAETLEVGIETKLGLSESIQQNPTYLESLGQLPDGPGNVMFYAAGSLWEGLVDADILLGTTRPGLDDIQRVDAVVAAASVTDNGIRVDAAATMDPKLAEAYANPQLPSLIDLVPDDALFHFAGDYGAAMDEYRTLFTEEAALSGTDFTREFGFDPVADGLDLLDGRFAVYGVPGRAPAGSAEFDFGGAIIMGVTSADRMNNTLDKVSQLAESEAGMIVERSGDLRYMDIAEGAPLAFGVLDDYLIAAWNTDPVADRAGSNVRTAAGYGRLADELGNDLTLFVDVPGLIDHFGEEVTSEDLASARPFRQIGGTWTANADGIVTGSLLVLIDWSD